MFKRIALILVAVLMTVPVFATGQADTGSSAEPAGPVTIELWYGAAITEAGPPPADWAVLQLVRDKLNIDLKLTALPSNESDQDVKINAAAAANALPDLFMVRRDPWLNPGCGLAWVAPVDELYPLMPNRTAVQYNADSKAFTTINGKSYGLASPGSIAKNEGMLIRKDWLDKLGLEVTVTTEEYLAVMRAFTFNDPRRQRQGRYLWLWCLHRDQQF
ncbi:MAG: hypothetical protein U5R30_11070 [Deltaproteobacteria bacterium]|nr:hypothetical protein [Deltaproteobacteria bacterium]